jgi:hypothetical protein
MKIWLVLPALFLLTGCVFFKAEEHDPRAECAWQANSDPKVTDLTLKQFTVTPSDPPLGPDIAMAKHEAIQRCLQAKGLIAPGGVEPLRPRY